MTVVPLRYLLHTARIKAFRHTDAKLGIHIAINLKTTFFWIFILYNNISIQGTLLMQNFVRKLIKSQKTQIFGNYSLNRWQTKLKRLWGLTGPLLTFWYIHVVKINGPENVYFCVKLFWKVRSYKKQTLKSNRSRYLE